jgi:membrane protein DedA with SNARE-associated domain
MIGEITTWIMDLMRAHGPLTVFIGVIIESVIVPIPSPLIIMGAGAILIDPALTASQATMPIVLKIVLPGAVASTIGAYFAFLIAYWGGKPVIDRFKGLLGFSFDDVMAMEQRLMKRVNLMIFLLRALPIVPLSLISAAAGVLRLPPARFGLWTFLGSIPRCFILGWLGFLMRDTYRGFAEHLNSVETLVSGAIVAGSIALILWLRARMRRP